MRADRRQGEVAAKFDYAPAEGLGEAHARGELPFEHVGNDFAVCLGGAGMAFDCELLAELAVVLDDAVVDDGDGAGAVEVGMGIVLDRGAMGCPAGMADPGSQSRRRLRGGRLERIE